MATDAPSSAPSHSRPLVDFLAGTAGGVAGIAVGHPFDTVKVRFQNPVFNGQYASTLSAFQTIVKQEKFTGLYKGVVSPIIGIAPVNGLIFASFKGAMAYLVPPGSTPPGEEAPLLSYFYAGCFSGLVASFVNCPTELVKIRQQSFPGAHAPSTWSLFKEIWAKGGLKGSFRGFNPCWMRDLGYGPYFLTYEYILRKLSPTRPPGPRRPDLLAEIEDEIEDDSKGWWAVALAGGVAGVVSWTTTFPFDVLKTRMQAPPSPLTPASQDPYRTLLSSTRHSYSTGGLRSFYVGLAPTLMRAIPTNIATFLIFELVVAVA